MKRKMIKTALALAAALSALTLAACSKGPGTDEISNLYQSAAELSAQANITAISGVLVEYEISYRLSNGAAEVTILRPEVLEGVTAQLRQGSAEIRYDGVSAETLLPGIPGFTPVDSLHGALADLAGGVPLDSSREQRNGQNAVALTYAGEYDGRALEKRIWLDEHTLAIVACEFYVDGQMVMRMEISSINIF